MVRRFTRDVLWKEAQVDGHKVAYLDGHDPHDLVQLVSNPVNEFVDSNRFDMYGNERKSEPEVYRAKYKRGFAAVRKFLYPDSEIKDTPSNLFKVMQDATLRNVGFVEVPIAAVVNSKGETAIVSKWKYGKRTQSLGDYLRDGGVSFLDKKKGVCNAADLLARLHSRGYAHNHAHTRNFIVVGRGKVSLIDPTMLSTAGNSLEGLQKRSEDVVRFLKTVDTATNFSLVMADRKDLQESAAVAYAKRIRLEKEKF